MEISSKNVDTGREFMKSTATKKSGRHIRRKLLYLAAFLLAILTGWLIWGNRSLEVTELSVPVKKLPVSFEGLKIAHVSDLHSGRFGKKQETLLSAIEEAKPDLIALTGDLMDYDTDDLAEVREFVEGAVKIAPVYYVTGNHEAANPIYQNLFDYLEQAGVVLLFDRAETITRGEESVTLLGLSDLDMPGVGSKEAVLERLETLCSETEGCKILLSHRPELIENVYAGRAELVLSGHAHGGQVRLPLIGGLFAPGQGLFPKYTSGLYSCNDTQMVVSRGLGGPAPRVNNRPQLLILTLSCEQ
jgi:predicted MPP superfamily phosphohydrolase